jgi:hypothetical protein
MLGARHSEERWDLTGLFKNPRCKAPEGPRREVYLAYIDRQGTRETQQLGGFQQPLLADAEGGENPIQNLLRDILSRHLTQGAEGFPEVEGDELW